MKLQNLSLLLSVTESIKLQTIRTCTFIMKRTTGHVLKTLKDTTRRDQTLKCHTTDSILSLLCDSGIL